MTTTALAVQSQSYYSGNKESEVPAVRNLLKENGLSGEKITLDALHCKPKTLEPIARAGGTYLVGLKKNQKEMFEEVVREIEQAVCLVTSETLEKGHGRIEHRKYQVYDIADIYKDERWANCQIRTALKVSRQRHLLKSGKQSQETSYYLSNEKVNYQQLCGAVRNHWSVETNNHIRDVTLREDKLRTKKRLPTEF